MFQISPDLFNTISYQVQTVTLAANEALSGEFTVTYPGVGTTEPLAHDASSDVFAAAIRALDNPDDVLTGAVTVSRSRTGVRGYAWTVTFDDLGQGNRPELVAAATTSLETRTPDGTFSLGVEPLADGVEAIGGSFEISFTDPADTVEESTGPLAAHNVSAREVEAAVEAMSGVGDVAVDVELLDGGEGGRVFTVTWPQSRGNVPALQLDGAGLTPTLADVGGVASEAATAFVDQVRFLLLVVEYLARMLQSSEASTVSNPQPVGLTTPRTVGRTNTCQVLQMSATSIVLYASNQELEPAVGRPTYSARPQACHKGRIARANRAGGGLSRNI